MQKLTSFLNEWTLLSKPLVKLVSLVIQPYDIPSSQLDLFLLVEEASWIWKPSIHIHMNIYHKSVTPQYRTTIICGHDSLWKVIPSYKKYSDFPPPVTYLHPWSNVTNSNEHTVVLYQGLTLSPVHTSCWKFLSWHRV